MEKDFFGMELFSSPMWFTWIIGLTTSLQLHLRIGWIRAKQKQSVPYSFQILRGGPEASSAGRRAKLPPGTTASCPTTCTTTRRASGPSPRPRRTGRFGPFVRKGGR